MSLCTDSGCVMRNTAWRTSLALNSPQLSWNLTPLRSQTVQLRPSGAISHFSASSGMYAPVWRSMPTRNSKAGLLSRLLLRGASQVKLVSHPRGATAMRSRSSFAFAGAGRVAVCAHAPVTAQLIAQRTPTRHPRRRYFCIALSFFVSHAHALRKVLLERRQFVVYKIGTLVL